MSIADYLTISSLRKTEDLAQATVRLADRSETLGCKEMEMNLCPKKLVHRNLVMDIFSLECARPKCSEVVTKSDMLA